MLQDFLYHKMFLKKFTQTGRKRRHTDAAPAPAPAPAAPEAPAAPPVNDDAFSVASFHSYYSQGDASDHMVSD
jgi:hypothetical protein